MSEKPANFVAEINGHEIYRSPDGRKCCLWTRGIGWWGFDLSEADARRVCEATDNPQGEVRPLVTP